MQTPEQAKRVAIIKEAYVGIIGWAWIAACVATLYFLAQAIFYDGSWRSLLGSVALTWLLYHVSLFYHLEKENVSKEQPHSVGDVMEAYGKLLEKHPTSINDASLLPLPKSKMKALLKALYAQASGTEQKSLLEIGFMFLSNFQDGVGAVPIDGRGALHDKWLVWQEASNAEAEILLAEWKRFKQGEPI